MSTLQDLNTQFTLTPGEVVVQRIKVKKTVRGGTVFAVSTGKKFRAGKKPLYGKVIAIGTRAASRGGKHRIVQVKVGDRVLFSRSDATKVKVKDANYFILKQAEILGLHGDPTTDPPPVRKKRTKRAARKKTR